MTVILINGYLPSHIIVAVYEQIQLDTRAMLKR